MPEENKIPEHMIYSNQGVPFKSDAAAKAAITQQGLDRNLHETRSHEDGYVIIRKPMVVKEEKYYRIVFNNKQSPNDEEDVTLIVNGDPLVIKRGVEVILPERYKECADHAVYPHFEQKPNQARKEVGKISIFPYSLYGEATKEDYIKALTEGNKATSAALNAAAKLI